MTNMVHICLKQEVTRVIGTANFQTCSTEINEFQLVLILRVLSSLCFQNFSQGVQQKWNLKSLHVAVADRTPFIVFLYSISIIIYFFWCNVTFETQSWEQSGLQQNFANEYHIFVTIKLFSMVCFKNKASAII